MAAHVPGLIVLISAKSPEDLATAEALEQQRQRARTVEAFRVDRSAFAHPLLEQASRQLATTYADEEAAIARKRGKTPATRLEALQRLTAPPSWWRRRFGLVEGVK